MAGMKTACVKLYNSTVRECWCWFRTGLRIYTIAGSEPLVSPKKVRELEELVDSMLKAAKVETHPTEPVIERIFDGLCELALGDVSIEIKK